MPRRRGARVGWEWWTAWARVTSDAPSTLVRRHWQAVTVSPKNRPQRHPVPEPTIQIASAVSARIKDQMAFAQATTDVELRWQTLRMHPLTGEEREIGGAGSPGIQPGAMVPQACPRPWPALQPNRRKDKPS